MGNKDSFSFIIKDRVKEALKQEGKTQKEMAADLDITPEHLTRCLTKGKISKTWLIAIAQYLDVSTTWLSGETNIELTNTAECRAELLLNQDDFLQELFLFFGFSSDEYQLFTITDIENLKADINLAISYWLSKVIQRKEKGE